MKLLELVRERRWIPVAGYLIYVSALTAGYYYNLTFVQLGLIDLGTRLVGLRSRAVSIAMAALALLTLVVALGYLLGQRLVTARPGVATGAGVIAVMVLLEVLGFVPVVGDLVVLVLLVVGLGAVVLTYFGLTQFEPVSLPE